MATLMETLNVNDLNAFEQQLPPAPAPVGSYVPCIRHGDLVYTSGMIPMWNGELSCTGAVGGYGVDDEAAQEAARHCILNALSVIRAEIGSLQNVERIIKLTGYVNSTPAYTNQPGIINAASNLLVDVFGDKGKHARAAVGVAALPLGASVEIDLIVQVKP